MKPKKISRRTALVRLAEMGALAAGLGAVETKKLLAQMTIKAKSLPDVTKLIGVSTPDRNVKALKILLMPKARTAEVFRSEWGRDALTMTTKNQFGVSVCPAYLGSGGACFQLECGVHVCNADTCQAYANYGPDIHFDDCSTKCSANCPRQGKPCWFNKKHINLGEISSNWLNEMRTDPFIQGLFKEFNATSADALALDLRNLLNQRKLGL